jgi:hypothetical protein
LSLFVQRSSISDAALAQALPREQANRNLRLVQPTAVLGSVVHRCQQQSAMLGATARAAICLMRLDCLRRLFGRMTGLALPREHLLSSGHRQAGEESAEVHVGEALCQTNQGKMLRLRSTPAPGSRSIGCQGSLHSHLHLSLRLSPASKDGCSTQKDVRP